MEANDSSMRAASQLPGRGHTGVDDALLFLHVNQKSVYDYDDDKINKV